MKNIIVATIVAFIILAFTHDKQTAKANTQDDAIIFSCTQSLDGICYITQDGTGECYTSAGISIGECKLNDTIYPKQDPYICKPKDDQCAYVTSAAIVNEVLRQYPDMYTYVLDTPDDYLQGYCLQKQCYTYKGYSNRHYDILMRHHDKVVKCYPALDEPCPLTASMVVTAAKRNNELAVH